ncbi:MAG: DNA topoisomerase [Clostridia bacterium]|nr:DNA topoisomerase [Clostridia bacterium]
MAKAKEKDYGNQSIQQLKGADRVRLRPAVIFGSDGLDGCEHSFFEILSNSVDEAREGYGDVITVTAYSDHSIEVEDNGRGVPLGWNEREQQYNWFLVYCELYAGGKYNNGDSGAYEFSLGLNGLGAAATQFSSEFMEVSSYSGGYLSKMSFKKGEPDGELSVTELGKGGKRHGTVIKWRPDLEVFKEIEIPHEFFYETLKKQAVVNAGLKFILRTQNGNKFDQEEFIYPEGIVDRVNELSGEKRLCETKIYRKETEGKDREDLPMYKLKMEFAITFSNTDSIIEYNHNSSWLEHGGSPEKATKLAFVYAFDKYLKSKDKYKKNESKITFADIEDCLVLIVNSFSTQTSYANQTKKAITNAFIASAMTDFFKQALEVYFLENPIDAERAANQILLNKRSRETAENTRLDIKKRLGGTMDVTSRVEKFVACRSKDPEKRELYIVEGDSALGSCKLGRNSEFQAIIPVRGKTLNCLKSTYDKILKNDIIVDLLKVIGCGIEVKTKNKEQNAFDLNALKWNKIIICTDADEDGYQIRTLLLTLFYRLLPTLIKIGKIYIAESPLFEITTKDDETFFAYNEIEKAEIVKTLEEKGMKYTLMRSKGLGENQPDMMWKTTMNPASRRLIRVCEDEAQKTAETMDMFLGDNLEARKAFIALNGKNYINEADL